MALPEHLTRVFAESDQLAAELEPVIVDLSPVNDSERVAMATLACSLALEHWGAARALLQEGVLPSALVVHRAQYEALTRSIWLTYGASDENVAKFAAGLTLDTEQAAKNTPLVHEMLQQLELKAPRPAYDGLARFREHNWRALNSYAHAGIHPLQRHRDGYPVELLRSVLCNANGLGVFSCMQAVILGGEQALQQRVLAVAAGHPNCLPPPL